MQPLFHVVVLAILTEIDLFGDSLEYENHDAPTEISHMCPPKHNQDDHGHWTRCDVPTTPHGRPTPQPHGIVLKTKPVRWFDQKKPKPKPSPVFLRVTGPTKEKPEKLHKNNVFSRGDDPKT
jgi:hypothetical protein